MSLKLSSTNTVPPGGFRYLIPETGTWIKDHTSLDDLEDAVLKHYKANGVPAPTKITLHDLIQDQLCKSLPPGQCKDSRGFPWASLLSGVMHYANFKQATATLVDWYLNGKVKVTTDEVKRRSEICVGCIHNQEPQGCSSCNMDAIKQLIVKVVGGEHTEYDPKLQGCAVCSCALKAKTRIPLDILKRHTSPEQMDKFPEYCWMKG